MSDGRKIAFETKAWFTGSWQKPQDVVELDERALQSVTAFSTADMESNGWFQIGRARIVIEFFPLASAIEKKIDALQAERQRLRANTEATCTRIEGEIQNLLALSYTPKE